VREQTERLLANRFGGANAELFELLSACRTVWAKQETIKERDGAEWIAYG
jgi:hypothetical protein